MQHEKKTEKITYPRMRHQMMLQRKRHFALVASKRSIGGMQQQMRIQAMLPRERLATVSANMRPLT